MPLGERREMGDHVEGLTADGAGAAKDDQPPGRSSHRSAALGARAGLAMGGVQEARARLGSRGLGPSGCGGRFLVLLVLVLVFA